MATVRGAVALAAALLLGGCGDEPPAAVAYRLILDAQGVVFAGDDTTHARFPFGSPRAAIEETAAVVYGAAAATRSVSDACAAGPMAFTSYGPIQLAFRQGHLTGWTMRRGAAAAVEGSIALGITRAQLQDLAAIHMVRDPSMPDEFAYRTPAGVIRGVLSGPGSQAQVEALFAGTVCTGGESIKTKEEP